MTDENLDETPTTGAPATEAETAAPEAPTQYGVGPFSIREVALIGVLVLAFVFSFFPLNAVLGQAAILVGGSNVWTSGLSWILAIGLPTAAVALIVLRRLSPEGIRRVGSLGIDQVASVTFIVAALVWLQWVWETIAVVMQTGLWMRSWVIWVELVLMLAGVVLTVLAPVIPVFEQDFQDRPEIPAHRNARPVRAVAPRPKRQRPAPAAPVHHTPQLDDASAPAQGYQGSADAGSAAAGYPAAAYPAAGAHDTGAVAYGTPHAEAPSPEAPYDAAASDGAVYDAGARDTGSLDAGGQDAVAHDAAGQDAGAYDAGAYSASAYDAGVSDPGTQATDVFAPLSHQTGEAPTVDATTSDATTSEQWAAVDETVVTGSTSASTSAHEHQQHEHQQHAQQAFWALVPVERDIVDEYGRPLFRIGPTAWALVIEDRGPTFVVRHEDGRIGYLHDTTGITRG